MIKYLLQSAFSEEREKFLLAILESAKKGLPFFDSQEPSPLPPLPFIVQEGNRFYLQKNWIYTTKLSQELARLQSASLPSFYDQVVFERALLSAENLSSEQKEALIHLFSHSFAILFGGPGTGKTYTARVFVELLALAVGSRLARPLRIAMTAPTGKAALHLGSSMEALKGVYVEVSTLHRLLKLRPSQAHISSLSRLDFDVVIVDEASMIDVSLFAHLLSCIGSETKLILMGDPHQLPPVDGGRIFHEWTKLFGKKLSLCRRTDNLQLQENGAAILRGDVDCFFASVDWEETFSQDWLDRLYEQINPLISEDPIDPDHCFTQFTQFRVLNALRQGSFGVDALNQEIFRRMEKKCPEGWWWAVPILSTANLPAINLSNGSFGVIIGRKKGRIDLSKGSAYFEEHRGEKSPRLPSYELSFLLSVHKSQGSEFNEVLAIFPDGSESFGKEILYTAATRAKLRWKGMGPKKVIAQLLVSLRL